MSADPGEGTVRTMASKSGPEILQLGRTLRLGDGLAMVVGIMVGSGIFRTPGLVAAQLGRPWLTFVAWALGGGVGLLGALVFAELATRHPHAGGKYVYAREAFGRRAGFVIGWVEAGIYAAAIAAISVVCGEYLARLTGWSAEKARLLGAGIVALLAGINLAGAAMGRFTQNVATAAKVLALAAVVVAAGVAGTGAGWTSGPPAGAPAGVAVWVALALAFQSVIWTYYGYLDAAKIAEEVVDPDRTLPRIFLLGIGTVTALYLLLNAAFLHVLPLDRIAASTLVAGDVVDEIFGARAATVMSALALLVVLASLNGNVFVTPRVVFGLARDGLAPRVLARVHRGNPWAAMLLVGAVSFVLAATGTFERLLSLTITLILVIDGFMVIVLFRLKARKPEAPFRVPLHPFVPASFLLVYALLFVATAREQPGTTGVALAVLAVAYALGGQVSFLSSKT